MPVPMTSIVRGIQMTLAWRTFLTVAALMPFAAIPASSKADEPKLLPVAKPQDIETVTEFLKTQPRNFIFNGHTGSVMWLTFTPDGKTLASSSRDATINIWDVSKAAEEKATLLKKIKHHTRDVYCVAYSPEIGRASCRESVQISVGD